MPSIAALLAEAADRLEQAGIEQPRREARLLLAHVLGCTAAELLGRPAAAEADAADLEALLRRRESREPMAYLTGRQGFWTLDLAVSPETLIPRADSETLIEAARAALPGREAVRLVLDLGTGTGCLLLAALTEFPGAFGVGVDRSASAARIAAANARACGMGARASILVADWSRALAPGIFELVLCNPPYIASAAIEALAPEVRGFEPRAALDGGPDGFCGYRRVLEGLPAVLAPGGVAVLEAGIGQAPGIARLAARVGLAPAPPHRDLNGVERAIVLRHARP